VLTQTLNALLPERGPLSRRQIARLAGQKPKPHHRRLPAQAAGDPQRRRTRQHRMEVHSRRNQTGIAWFDNTTTIPPSRPANRQAAARERGQ
jgi:hypothetical protein